MKQLAGLLILLGSLAVTAQAVAQETQLGVIVGSLTGISMKQRLDDGHAVDGALAYTFDGESGISLHGDYLFDPARRFDLGDLTAINMYYGLGVRVSDIDDGDDEGKVRAGIRAPLGVNYLIYNPNLEFFGEIVPVLDLAPSTDVYLNVGLGVRYRF